MGKTWDGTGIAFSEDFWREVMRVMKPNAYLLAFGGTRTYHRMAAAVEDAGFEVRDSVIWLHGQGFPKSKACLKPAHEPIILARKPGGKVPPLPGLDACRIGVTPEDAAAMARCNTPGSGRLHPRDRMYSGAARGTGPLDTTSGRWPANVTLDEATAAMLDEQSGECKAAYVNPESAAAKFAEQKPCNGSHHAYGKGMETKPTGNLYTDTGGASRFYYCSKASRADRGEGNLHPTVKSTALMSWLIRLITPEGGVVLDPFLGSGSTGKAAVLGGYGFVGIEAEAESFATARRRIATAQEAA